MKKVFCLAMTTMLFLGGTAFAQDEEEEKTVEVDSKSAGTITSKGKKLTIDGIGKTLTHACSDEKGTEITINGSNHKITLTGECKLVDVNGTNNTVTAEAIGSIKADGVGNAVRYERGLDGKAPKIKTAGLNNSVKKIEKK